MIQIIAISTFFFIDHAILNVFDNFFFDRENNSNNNDLESIKKNDDDDNDFLNN